MPQNNLSTRFPNGVTNRSAIHPFGSLRVPDISIYNYYFNDFFEYVAGDWVVTETQAGATQALTAGSTSALLLTNTSADNDYNQIQKTPACFSMAAGKKAFIGCRFQLNEVIQSDFAFGLQNINTDGTTLATATDGLFFLKADGAATVNCYFRQDNSTGSAVEASVATLVDATYIELSAYWDGVSSVWIYNGTTGAQFQLDVTSAMIPNANLAPIISLRQGEATNVKTATIDWLFCATER